MNPILEVFGIDWRILIVQIVNFSLLLAVLWYILYRPVLRLIDKRRAQIIEGVANAERADLALRDADAKKGAILTEANLEAEQVLVRARAVGKETEARLTEEAEAKAARLVLEAERKAEETKRLALAESEAELARLIVLGVEKTLRQSAPTHH